MADESYWLEDECLPEMTFLDYTTDSTMEITSNEGNTSYIQPPELSKHNRKTAGTDQNAKMVDTPDREGQPERWMDERYFPEITLLEVTRDSDLSPAADMSTMEVTQDVPPVDAVKPRRPSSELSGLIVAEPDGPGMMQSEELSSTLTGSVTNTTSSFSEQSKSVQENVKSSLEATRDISVGSVLENTSSSELSGQSMKSQTSPEDTLGILPSNVTRDLSSSSDVSVQSAESQIAPSDVQSATRLKNVTIEIQAKRVETSIAAEANEEELLTGRDTESTGKEPQTTSDLSDSTNLNTTDPSPGARNKTLDLPPSDVNSPKAESVAADQVGADVQSATDTSPDTNQNSSAAESGESCDVQNGNDTHSLQKSCGTSALGETGAATFSLQNTFDSKPNGTITETSSSDSRQNTFDKPSPDRETKDHSQSVPDGLSESLGHQGTDTENHQANTFNLDDTLDLKVVLPETSTPMPSCKDSQFSFQHDTGRAIAAAKKLYGDGPSKPVVQVPPDVPSNLVTNRKTLMQPAAKSHLPPLKAASQLLKYHPTSALPGRCEPATSRLPMTRQRTQTEAVKNPAPSAQGLLFKIPGISSSYNLRATTTASKQPNSGLPRPPMSSIPSGFQRSAPGLRPPSAKSNLGPAAANPGTKLAQPNKHPLTRAEPLPTAKRKKTDAPGPSSGAETSTRSQKPTVNHHRSQPAKPQGHGCAKCAVLMEENKRLKEELLKCTQRGEDC